MKLAVLGRTHWLLRSAHALLEAGHEIVLIATGAPSPEYLAGPADLRAMAERCGAVFWTDRDLNEASAIAEIRVLAPHLAVSINWPTLVRKAAIAAFPNGILNAHAGDLPRYRGNACPNWAIINNEPHVGLCIHAMDPDALDAGAVYVRRRLPLTDEVYIGDVYRWMDEAVPAMFVEAVDLAADPAFIPQDQATAGVRPLRTHPRRPEDGCIDWNRPAAEIARLVRASSRPFAGAFSHLDGGPRVTVWRARAVSLDHDISAVPGQVMGRGASGGVLVACSSGALEIEDSEREDGVALSAANRWRLTDAR